MTPAATDVPLKVSTDGTAGPYVVVTSEQLGAVTEALRAEEIRFHIDQDAVLLSGAPALAVIDLGMDADVLFVQGVLDRVASELQHRGRRGRAAPTRKELIILGDTAGMSELRQRFNAGPCGGWARRSDVEQRFRQAQSAHTIVFCFSKVVPGVNGEVAVLLQGRFSGIGDKLHLTSIVPLTERGQLDLAQRNRVVADFRETFLTPLAEGIGVRVLDRSVSTRPSLEQVLSPVAVARLRAFSTRANRGGLHPQDQQRWNEFVGQTHRDETLVDLGLLDEWLEEESFPLALRKDLVGQFEAGRNLLASYDEERPA